MVDGVTRYFAIVADKGPVKYNRCPSPSGFAGAWQRHAHRDGEPSGKDRGRSRTVASERERGRCAGRMDDRGRGVSVR
jgi:hypothetical protein